MGSEDLSGLLKLSTGVGPAPPTPPVPQPKTSRTKQNQAHEPR